jgi:general secretion pathway protein J
MRNKYPMTTGFTLIELLVAISVLAIVAVLGWRGLDSIVRGRTALNAELEQTRGMQLTFAQLESDCAHIASVSTLAGRSPLQAAQGRLTLIRTVFADFQPSRLQVISYRLRNGQLIRRESAETRDLGQLDALWQAAVSDTDTAQAVILQSDVATMTLRQWRNGVNGWDNTDVAPDVSNPVIAATAVTGLEVALQLRGRDSSMIKLFLLGTV